MARVGVLFELQGARGFEQALERASEQVRKQAAIAVRTTALAVVNRARANAPKDRGDLARSITTQGKGMTWRVGILDTSIMSRGGRNTAHLNPWVYGVWYEYGFVTRKIPAHPFMKPAAEAEEAHHERRMEQAINSGLAAVA